MPTFVPTPTAYADKQVIKRVLRKLENDAGADPELDTCVADATLDVQSVTGRVWCADLTGDPLPTFTRTYDAPYSSILLVDELADVTGVVVKVGGVTLTTEDFTWLARTILSGQYRHVYALALGSGMWADSALAVPRSLYGDVELSNITHPATTDTPPSPIIQATERIAVALYRQRSAVYAHQSSGTEDIGIVPPPDGVVNADTEAVLGPWVRPDRPLGRP